MSDRITIACRRVGNAKSMYVAHLWHKVVVQSRDTSVFPAVFSVFQYVHPTSVFPADFSVFGCKGEARARSVQDLIDDFCQQPEPPPKFMIRAACKIARNNPAGAVLERRDGKWAVVEVKADE